MPSLKINGDAIAIVLTVVGAAFFLGALISKTQTMVESNSATLQKIEKFVENHANEKLYVFEQIAEIKATIKQHHKVCKE